MAVSVRRVNFNRDRVPTRGIKAVGLRRLPVRPGANELRLVGVVRRVFHVVEETFGVRDRGGAIQATTDGRGERIVGR
jgi:hypothetical protein